MTPRANPKKAVRIPMPTTNTLNVAVIGLGHWGPNVVRNFSQLQDVTISAVCDVNPKGFDRVRSLVPAGCSFTTDAAELFEAPHIDALAVVTPATTHYPLVRQALLSGKHVLCEKPLTTDVAEGEELCQLAESTGKNLMVGYTFLYNNGVRHVRSLLDEGELGEMYYINATRTHLGLIRDDVDVTWDLASHDVAIMNYLMGCPPKTVSAVGAHPLGREQCDLAFLSLCYPGGVVGHIHVSWVNSNKERCLNLIGSKARVAFDDLNNLEPVRVFHKGIGTASSIEPQYGDFRFLLRDGDIVSPKITMREPLKQMIEEFVLVAKGEAKTISDSRFSQGVTQALCAAQRSLKLGGIPQEPGPC